MINIFIESLTEFLNLIVSTIFKPSLALFCIVLFDTITGICIGFKFKTFSITALSVFLKKIFIYIILIVIIRLFEIGISTDLEFNYASFIVIYYILFTETLSVFKNLAGLGVNIPVNNILYFFLKVFKYESTDIDTNDIFEITNFIKNDVKEDQETPFKHFLNVFLDIYYNAYNITNAIIDRYYDNKQKLINATSSYLKQLKKITEETLRTGSFAQCTDNKCNNTFNNYYSYIEKRCIEAINQDLDKYALKRRFKEIYSLVCFNILISYKNYLK